MKQNKFGVIVLLVALLLSLTLIVLGACDDAVKFTVTFVADGQTVSTIYCKENTVEIDMPAVPYKYGYVGHWERYVLNDNDLTVKAVYVPKQYTVTFDYNDADYKPIKETAFTFDQAVGSLPQPLKNNNYFLGWYWADIRITPDYVWDTDVEEPIELTAKWIPASETLTLKFSPDINAYCVVSVARDVRDVVVPSSYNGYPVTAIASQAFAYCLSLKSVLIPASVSSIGNMGLFQYSDSVESVTVHPDNMYYYSEGNCIIEKSTDKLIAGVCSSVIPSNVKSIGRFAFCKVGFETFSIPQGVQTVQELAFTACKNLTSISVSASVLSIEYSAFYNCEQLTTIYYDGTMAQWSVIYKSIGYNYTSLKQIVCRDGTIQV